MQPKSSKQAAIERMVRETVKKSKPQLHKSTRMVDGFQEGCVICENEGFPHEGRDHVQEGTE